MGSARTSWCHQYESRPPPTPRHLEIIFPEDRNLVGGNEADPFTKVAEGEIKRAVVTPRPEETVIGAAGGV